MAPAFTRPLVVIPALNEAGAVGEVVTAVREAHPSFAILVVDDGSVDDTAAIATAHGALVASHAVNLGVGGAMRTGFHYAYRHGYDAVVQVDGDGQHDPGQIHLLLRALRRHDVAVGSRFGPESPKYPMSLARRSASRILSRAVSIHCRTRITDATSGFRAAGPRAIPVFARHYPIEYLGDTVESLVLAGRLGLSVGQVPVTMQARTSGSPTQSSTSATMHLARAAFVTLQSFIRRPPAGAKDLLGTGQ